MRPGCTGCHPIRAWVGALDAGASMAAKRASRRGLEGQPVEARGIEPVNGGPAA